MLHNLIKKLTRILIANKFTFIALTFCLLSSITKPAADLMTPENYEEVLKAARCGNIEYLKEVMPLQVSPNGLAAYRDTWSPLHYAASSGQDDTVTFLLNCNADINRQDYEGLTPLHLAVQTGNLTTALCLINKGAHVNLNSMSGTPLDMVTQHLRQVTSMEERDKELVKQTYFALMRSGAKLNDERTYIIVTHLPEVIPATIFYVPATRSYFKKYSTPEQWEKIASSIDVLQKEARASLTTKQIMRMNNMRKRGISTQSPFAHS